MKSLEVNHDSRTSLPEIVERNTSSLSPSVSSIATRVPSITKKNEVRPTNLNYMDYSNNVLQRLQNSKPLKQTKNIPSSSNENHSPFSTLTLKRKYPDAMDIAKEVMPPPKKKFTENKKRKKNTKFSEIEGSILKTSENISNASETCKDVFVLKKELLQIRLKNEKQSNMNRKRNLPISGMDGYFNMFQRRWVKLQRNEREAFFEDIVNILEMFERSN